VIKITILYPASPGARFDHDYYETVHMPLSISLLGGAMRSVTVERGVAHGGPWPEPPFRAICSFVCQSLEAYQRAFMPHMERLQRDMPNYTDIQAIIQISDIVIEHSSAASYPDIPQRASNADLFATGN
jgi:uncharacterized protein (TIGR02118 family)